MEWLIVYATGVAIGLWRIDGSPLTRVALALTWPVGAVAAGVTAVLLLAAAALLFPLFGLGLAVLGVLAWTMWG